MGPTNLRAELLLFGNLSLFHSLCLFLSFIGTQKERESDQKNQIGMSDKEREENK